jgi:Leucine-rich repeat (LRR) protein
MDIIKKLELKQLSKEEIKKIVNIDTAHDYITAIPESFKLLTNLQKLIIRNNQIKIIPECFGHLTNLQSLAIIHGNITTIPECFGLLTKLQNLSFYENQIKIIPKCFGNLTNLRYLTFNGNQITTIPECLGNLTNLRDLSLSNNQITTIPEYFGNLTNLHRLCLNNNKITTIPECLGLLTNLKVLSLSGNEITVIPEYLGFLTNLSEIVLSYNQITTIPAALGRLVRCNFYLNDNPIEYIPPNVQRLLNQQKTQKNIYDDTQNVHEHTIQESIRNSIYSLLNDKCLNDNYIEQILISSLQTKTKQLLTEYSNDSTIHSLNFTFSELLKYVWNRIIKHEHMEELLKILDEEMSNAECKCFTGRISRLVNVLNGYYGDINIKISDNVQIGTVISNIKNKFEGTDIEELKEKIRRELINRQISDTVIEEWLEHVEL